MAYNLDNITVGDDMVNNVAVYLGGLNRLENITYKLKWKEYIVDDYFPCKELTLAEIREQSKELRIIKDGHYPELITVFSIEPLGGKIYQLGNYSKDKWALAGELKGYC